MERCIDWIHRQTFGTLLPLKHIKNNHVKKKKENQMQIPHKIIF